MKLLDVFATPEEARSHLKEKFSDCPMMLGKFRRMPDSQVIATAALFEGFSISASEGVSDICDKNAVARCNDLLSTIGTTKYYFPLQRTRVECINDLGTSVKGTVYYILPGDIEALKQPDLARSICRHVQAMAYQRKAKRDNAKFDELHREFPNATKLVARLADRKLKLKPKQKAQFVRELDALIASYTKPTLSDGES